MHTALITGGSRGIGAAIAEELSAQGVRIIAPARADLDLNHRGSVEAFCKGLDSLGVDILINNAGINFLSSFESLSDEHWDAMMQVNLHAARKLLQAVVPSMKSKAWGRVVNTSSVFSLVSRAQRTIYSMTKAALNSLTRTAAIELGPHGILVNAICPGYVETEMTHQNNSPADIQRILGTIPVGRLAQPADIAKVVAFLCSDANTYITGQSIVADGGFTLQ